ncbi:MAG: methyltransferase domain-containing protein [Acidimicrobiia bacterium]
MTTTAPAPANTALIAPGTTGLDERLIDSATCALELFSIHIGRTLGLYDVVDGGVTVAKLAAQTGINSRYAREWLEQQTVAGFIDVDDDRRDWAERLYRLNDSQRALLVHANDPSHVSPLADMIVGIGSVIPEVVAGFTTGEGVPYSHYGATFRDGQANINRPAFVNDLVPEWVTPAVPDIVERLRHGGRIADLGCGVGWSTVALTRAFPNTTVVGYDSDQGSIDDARSVADSQAVQAEFKAADAAQLADDGPFDLVVILEALHDMADPGAVLAAVRRSLAPGGAVLIADEAVADEFSADAGDLERMFYGWSVVHCLPAAMAETPSAAIGTVIRPSHIRSLVEDAGYASFDHTDIDGGFFNIYVAR